MPPRVVIEAIASVAGWSIDWRAADVRISADKPIKKTASVYIKNMLRVKIIYNFGASSGHRSGKA
jgi:hypothetical protein